MSDIIYELRQRSLRAEQDGEPIALLDEAADEINRLRGDTEIARLRLDASHGEIEKLQHRVRFQDSVIRSGDVATLTDAERECLEWAEEIAGNCEEFGRVEVLRALLERMGGER